MWSETLTLQLDHGFYSTALGRDSANPLALSDFEANNLYLSVAVNGIEIGERQRLGSTPYALHAASAASAASVSGGVVDAAEVLVNGTPVISSAGTVAWSSVRDVPPEVTTTLGSLEGCDSGHVATWSGSAWTCSEVPPHSHDLGELTGTLSAAQVSFNAADIGGLSSTGGQLSGDLSVSGQLKSSSRVISQGGQVHRDFATFSTRDNNNVPIHIKTNIKTQSNIMFRFLVEGYNYGTGQPINSEAVGYSYDKVACLLKSANVDHAGGVNISTYCSSDGYVVVLLESSSNYFLGMGISGWLTNPAGKGFNIEALEIVQQASKL